MLIFLVFGGWLTSANVLCIRSRRHIDGAHLKHNIWMASLRYTMRGLIALRCEAFVILLLRSHLQAVSLP